MDIKVISEMVHEVHRVYCNSIGDNTIPTWDNAQEWQKESTELGVRQIMLDDDITAEQNHNKWMIHKKANGWKYGDIKDIEKKEHPCLISFKKLPFQERVKDHLFVEVVKAINNIFLERLI